jgi:hypothetical protein
LKSQVEIKDKKMIDEILNSIEYGTLALCSDNKPYSVPVNFVYDENIIYFHGAKKGKTKDYIKENNLASLSVVEPYSVIQSYFSSEGGLACPATYFYKSVSCDGKIEFVMDYDEKVKALRLLMQKLQPEGKYLPLDNEVYQKHINVTEVFKLNIDELNGKLKLGQHLPKERFDMIIEYLNNRGYEIDKKTIEQMQANKVEENI